MNNTKSIINSALAALAAFSTSVAVAQSGPAEKPDFAAS